MAVRGGFKPLHISELHTHTHSRGRRAYTLPSLNVCVCVLISFTRALSLTHTHTEHELILRSVALEAKLVSSATNLSALSKEKGQNLKNPFCHKEGASVASAMIPPKKLYPKMCRAAWGVFVFLACISTYADANLRAHFSFFFCVVAFLCV